MGFDMSDVRRFAGVLLTSDRRVRPAVAKAVKKAAMNVKRDAQDNIRGQTRGQYTKHYPKAITFEMQAGGLQAEVGPEVGRKQAFLGKILEFGTATSPAYPHLYPAADAEIPGLEQGIMQAVDDAMLEG